MKVTILRGISGAGKSTWAEAQVGARVVSTDHYFWVEGVYKFDQTKLQANHERCFRDFMAAVEAQEASIIVDNTNVSAWEYAPYVLAGQAYGYKVEILTFECAFETCRARKDWLSTEHLKSRYDRLQQETRHMPPHYKALNRTLDTNN